MLKEKNYYTAVLRNLIRNTNWDLYIVYDKEDFLVGNRAPAWAWDEIESAQLAIYSYVVFQKLKINEIISYTRITPQAIQGSI